MTMQTTERRAPVATADANKLAGNGKFRDADGEFFIGSIGNPGYKKPRRILCYRTKGGIVGASARWSRHEAKQNALAAAAKAGANRKPKLPRPQDELRAELEAAIPEVPVVVKADVSARLRRAAYEHGLAELNKLKARLRREAAELADLEDA